MNPQIGAASGGNGEQPGGYQPNRLGNVNMAGPVRRTCLRCYLGNTTFALFNNNNQNQPRYLCKSCRRTWLHGGTLPYVTFRTSTIRNRSPTGLSMVLARGIPSTSQQQPIALAPPTSSGLPVVPVAPFPMGSSLISGRGMLSTSQQPPMAFSPTTFSGYPVPSVAPFPMGSSLLSARDIPSTSQQPSTLFAARTFSGLPVPPVAPFPMGSSLLSARDIPSTSQQPPIAFAPTALSGLHAPPVATSHMGSSLASAREVPLTSQQPTAAFAPPTGLPVPLVTSIPTGTSLASSSGIPSPAPATLSGPRQLPFAAFPGDWNNMVFTGENSSAGLSLPSLARSGQQSPVAQMTVLRPRQLLVSAVPVGSSLASARGIPPIAPATFSGFPTPPVAPNPDNGNYNVVLRGENYNAGGSSRSHMARSGQRSYTFSNFSSMQSYFLPNNAQDQLLRVINYQSQVEIEIGGPSSTAGGSLSFGVQPDAPPPPMPDPIFGNDFNNENNIQWSDYLADGGNNEP